MERARVYLCQGKANWLGRAANIGMMGEQSEAGDLVGDMLCVHAGCLP